MLSANNAVTPDSQGYIISSNPSARCAHKVVASIAVLLWSMPNQYHYFNASTFLSSSLLPVSDHAFPRSPQSSRLTSTASKTPHSYHHHPNSPPTNVYSHPVLRLLLVSSLPMPSAPNCQPFRATHKEVGVGIAGETVAIPSTGKSSNSSSSSSAAGGFCGWSFIGSPSGFFSSVSLVVAVEPAAVPDILLGCRSRG